MSKDDEYDYLFKGMYLIIFQWGLGRQWKGSNLLLIIIIPVFNNTQ